MKMMLYGAKHKLIIVLMFTESHPSLLRLPGGVKIKLKSTINA